MCTGFIKKGNDTLFGFNLDIDPEVWNYGLYMNESYFSVGIKVGKTLYLTHGVNSKGHFSNLPYMNDYNQPNQKLFKKRERIDLLTDRYIRNKYSYDDVVNILNTKSIVNIPSGSMHTLLANNKGDILLIEPSYGYKEIKDNYVVITNYPLLVKVDNYEPWFGKDRFDKATEILSNSNDNFDAKAGLKLLNEVKQTGKWATRISFVYSLNENTVYYFLDGDINNIKKHNFK